MSRIVAITFGCALGLASPGSGCAQDSQSDWHYVVTVYGWFTGIEGRVRARATDGETNISLRPSDVLDRLEFAAFGAFEARRGRLGLIIDAFYAGLGASQTPPAAPSSRISGDVDLPEGFSTWAAA